MARNVRQKRSSDEGEQDLPLWAVKMMEKLDSFIDRLENVLASSFDRMLKKIDEISSCQDAILKRISALEEKVSGLGRPSVTSQSEIYSTMVKVKTDERKIDDKLRRIAWIGVAEQRDEVATRRFDQEALKEVVETSGDEELIEQFRRGSITIHRHPAGQPKGPSGRCRILKIDLPSQDLKDRLLYHMRSGRQSLTKEFVHSYARRDYTTEELELDRSLRKQAGELNSKCGMLQFIVRDLQICKLKKPRELPLRSSTATQPGFSSQSTSRHFGTSFSCDSQLSMSPSTSIAIPNASSS